MHRRQTLGLSRHRPSGHAFTLCFPVLADDGGLKSEIIYRLSETGKGIGMKWLHVALHEGPAAPSNGRAACQRCNSVWYHRSAALRSHAALGTDALGKLDEHLQAGSKSCVARQGKPTRQAGMHGTGRALPAHIQLLARPSPPPALRWTPPSRAPSPSSWPPPSQQTHLRADGQAGGKH